MIIAKKENNGIDGMGKRWNITDGIIIGIYFMAGLDDIYHLIINLFRGYFVVELLYETENETQHDYENAKKYVMKNEDE